LACAFCVNAWSTFDESPCDVSDGASTPSLTL
jgi:hypothetical protein